jgi:hypothetical protein
MGTECRGLDTGTAQRLCRYASDGIGGERGPWSNGGDEKKVAVERWTGALKIMQQGITDLLW